MTQRISRILILLAASGLAVSGARLRAQANATPSTPPNSTPPASNTKPNAKLQPRPKQPAAAPAGAVPPMLQAGITAMLSAKTTLEAAGDKWGGHRIKAIKLIDQALNACGQTQTPGKGEMKSGPTDDTAAMQTATADLTKAQKDFQNAKNTWGGRRDQALPFITQALQELQLAATAQKGPKKTS